MNKLKPSENTYKFDIILDKIFDFYCALKISWHQELKNLKIKWKPIFDFEWKPYIKDIIYSIDEINELTQLYLLELIEHENISNKNFFLYWRDRVMKFESRFNSIISSYFNRLTWFYSSEVQNALSSWNLTKISNHITRVKQETKKALERKETLAEAQNNLEVSRDYIRKERKSWNNDVIVWWWFSNKTEESREYEEYVPSNDISLLIDKIVYKLLSSSNDSPRITNIRTKVDLMEYYNHESWVEPTEENLDLILKKYKQELELMEIFWITPEQKRALLKLAQKAKQEKFIALNNPQVMNYIENELKWTISKASIHMVKIFKDNLK